MWLNGLKSISFLALQLWISKHVHTRRLSLFPPLWLLAVNPIFKLSDLWQNFAAVAAAAA